MNLDISSGSSNKTAVKQLIKCYLYHQKEDPSSNNFVPYTCFQPKIVQQNSSTVDRSITNAQRTCNHLKNTKSGRITFGIRNNTVPQTYLGKVNGQLGGSEKPLRNKFV